MKKVMTTLALLLVAVGMSAQFTGVKLTPKYQKGDQVRFHITSTLETNGTAVNLSADNRYVVTEATPAGYTISETIENAETDAQDVMGQMISASLMLSKGLTTIYEADADGRITGIQNYEEVKNRAMQAVDKMVDEWLTSMPELAQMMPAEVLKEQIASALSVEKMLASVTRAPSPFTLNGKTIATGSIEESTDEDGRRVKNVYFLTSPDGRKVKVTTAFNMTKDEMKKMVIDQIKKILPDQAEVIEQNIDTFMATGQMDFKLDQTVDYEFDERGWLKTYTLTQKQQAMGQETLFTSTSTRVE